MDTQQLLADLTPAQREAVTHIDGPLLIIAGAGSGKTRVITRRVAYLVAQGIVPASILAITFTNKAAGEMKSRISALLPRPLRDFGRLDQHWPTICTFHSLCLRILKHYAAEVGLAPSFTIYDSGDQEKLIKEAMKALEVNQKDFTPGSVHAAISNAKNQLLTPEAFAADAGGYRQQTVAKIYAKYQKLLEQNQALDFDDLLLKTAHAFRAYPNILRELQERFQYVLIDEYQDTNHAQYIIAHALANRPPQNLCVVGDPDQSIYAWRGADIRNILDFERDYPSATVVRLEQNYRSTKRILQIASRLIERNTQRKKKELWTENEAGEKATVLLCQDEHDEARAVAERLRELHQKGYAWNAMAVFYRINALSRVMEDALRKSGMPYVMARGVEFYSRKVIKDVLGYLRVIANPADEVNLLRIINVPTRGIGDGAIRKLQVHALGNGIALGDVLEQAGEVEGMTPSAARSIGQFAAMLRRWRTMARAPGAKVRDVMEDVVRTSGIEQSLRKNADDREGEDPLANVNELISAAAEYDQENPEGSLGDYLGKISLVSDVDHLKDNGGAITMMTLHAAKGLEFPVVAMIGLEEGVLPHSRARDNPDEMEEERRLCFVGVTRAQQRLILSRAAYRTIRGLRERTVASPFLGEMPPEELEVIDRTESAWSGWNPADESQVPQGRFKRGQMVRHPSFGIGRIAELSAMGAQTRAVVEFNHAGRRILILEYARLEPVG